MAIDCKNPKDTNERNLCDCQNAVSTLKTAFDIYKINLEQRRISDQRLADWQNMTGEFSDWAIKKKQLEDKTKVWNNCVVWTGVYGHNDWCEADTGFGRQSGANQYGCPLSQGKGECKRTTDQVTKAMTDLGYYSQKPSLLEVGQPPSNINITCCSQLFNNISTTGGDVNISNVTQECYTKLNETINATPGTTPGTPPGTTPGTTPGTPPGTTPATTTEITSDILIIIIIVVVLLLISCISLFIIKFIN